MQWNINRNQPSFLPIHQSPTWLCSCGASCGSMYNIVQLSLRIASWYKIYKSVFIPRHLSSFSHPVTYPIFIPWSSPVTRLWLAGPHCFNANGPLRWQCVGLGLETVCLAHDIFIPSGSCDTTKDGASDGSELWQSDSQWMLHSYSML